MVYSGREPREKASPDGVHIKLLGCNTGGCSSITKQCDVNSENGGVNSG